MCTKLTCKFLEKRHLFFIYNYSQICLFHTNIRMHTYSESLSKCFCPEGSLLCMHGGDLTPGCIWGLEGREGSKLVSVAWCLSGEVAVLTLVLLWPPLWLRCRGEVAADLVCFVHLSTYTYTICNKTGLASRFVHEKGSIKNFEKNTIQCNIYCKNIKSKEHSYKQKNPFQISYLAWSLVPAEYGHHVDLPHGELL